MVIWAVIFARVWAKQRCGMISNLQKRKIKETAIAETKRFIAIALYIWLLLSVFELHRLAVLRGLHLKALADYRFGLAALNAVVLGKVIVIGQALRAGRQLSEKPLIYPILLKSALFALLLICFQIVEETVSGMVRGKSLAASTSQLGGGGLEGAVLVGVMACVALIPFFFFTEMQMVIGKEKVRSLLFQERSKTAANTQSQAPAA